MIKRGANKYLIGEPVLAVDLNDTFGGRNITNVTGQYTATADDDVIILKPNNTANTFLPVSLGGSIVNSDKNYCRSGNFIYMSISVQNIGRLDITTGLVVVTASTANGNGQNPFATDGLALFMSDLSTNISMILLSTNVKTVFATCPTAVHGLTRNNVTGNFYAVAINGIIYQITPAGVVTTFFSAGTWLNTQMAIAVDNSNNIFLSNGAISIKISGNIQSNTASFLPQVAFYYNVADNSIYYKLNNEVYARFNCATELISVICTGNYSSGAISTDGVYFYEGSSGGADQFRRILISTIIPLTVLSLPLPATLPGKEYQITVPYAFNGASAPYISSSKLLVDSQAFGTDNFLSNPVKFPLATWTATTRTIKCISDGINWLTFRS